MELYGIKFNRGSQLLRRLIDCFSRFLNKNFKKWLCPVMLKSFLGRLCSVKFSLKQNERHLCNCSKTKKKQFVLRDFERKNTELYFEYKNVKKGSNLEKINQFLDFEK